MSVEKQIQEAILRGELIGLRATIFVGAVGMFFPFLRLFFSPVRNLTEQSNAAG